MLEANNRRMRNLNEIQLRKIRETIRKFRHAQDAGEEGWKDLEKRLTEKRTTWFSKNRGKLNLHGGDLEKAYRAFFIHYLGLTRDEAPIIEKTDKRIVVGSCNFCPNIKASEELSLDTRYVCKIAYEKPVERFMQMINPKISFTRNYDTLRPHGNYCEETIEIMD